MIRQGFTLIEILIALLAASIISIMSFEYLSNSVFLKDRVEESIQQNNKHFNAVSLIRLDLMQTIPFKMKDTSGKDLNASFIGSKNEQMLKFITLNSSDSSMQHSKLRRVIYIYRDNELIRLTTLANKEDTILSEEIILTDVLNLKFTFGLEPENLTDEWPINNLNEDISFPDYIFMTYQYENQEFKQLFSTF